MKTLGNFLLMIIGVFAAGKIIAHLTAPLFHNTAPEKQQERITIRAPSLQELIHNMVIEARKDVPRKKLEGPGSALWLTNIDERQSQIVYTYEFVGVSLEAFDQNAPNEMRQEAVESFRARCGIAPIPDMLRQGMTVAHVYRIRETGTPVTTMVFSRSDC